MNEKAAKLARRAARAAGTLKKDGKLPRAAKRQWAKSSHRARGEYSREWCAVTARGNV